MAKLIALITILASAQHAFTQAPVWGQCGGIGWSGPTICSAGSTCAYLNEYHSQCLPNSTSVPATPPDTEGLNARMVAKGKKYFGSTVTNLDIYTYNPDGILTSEFGQVTPEGSMEWYITESSSGRFNWGLADILVNWATSNGQLVRGSSLISLSGFPSWLWGISDAATMTLAINNHISTVVGRYSGKWDVVKEILNEDGSYNDNIIYSVLGKDFVRIAFQAARAADPNAKLYINDFGLDSNNAKVQGIIRVINSVNSGRTRLIDGIGSQVKLGAGQAGGVQAALAALAETGLEVAITDLDIDGASPDDYSTVVEACLAVPRCIGITTAGIADTFPTIPHMLYDYNYQPTPAYSAVLDALA